MISKEMHKLFITNNIENNQMNNNEETLYVGGENFDDNATDTDTHNFDFWAHNSGYTASFQQNPMTGINDWYNTRNDRVTDTNISVSVKNNSVFNPLLIQVREELSGKFEKGILTLQKSEYNSISYPRVIRVTYKCQYKKI